MRTRHEHPSFGSRTVISRRALLGLGASAGLAALVGCAVRDDPTAVGTASSPSAQPAPTLAEAGSSPPGASGYTVSQMNAAIAAGERVYWAHRGGSRNWSEMTMRAYTNAVWHGATILEVSVRRALDGVWIMCHDPDLTRVTATVHVVADTPSTSLLGIAVDTPVEGGVIGRLEEILAAYADLVLLVDNKTNEGMAEFLALLQTVPDATDHIIVKIDGNAPLPVFTVAKAAGFAVAGYWYPANIDGFLPDRAPYTDYIGVNWDAEQTVWDAAAAYGKPRWGHVVADTTQADVAVAKGAQILQCADVVALIPAAER